MPGDRCQKANIATIAVRVTANPDSHVRVDSRGVSGWVGTVLSML